MCGTKTHAHDESLVRYKAKQLVSCLEKTVLDVICLSSIRSNGKIQIKRDQDKSENNKHRGQNEENAGEYVNALLLNEVSVHISSAEPKDNSKCWEGN